MTTNSNKSKKRHYLQALDTAASGNAQAFGFSILVTVSYGIISTSAPPPTIGQQFGFAMAAVAAFSLFNVAIAYLARHETSAPESERVVLIATATDFMAVGAGLGVAFGVDFAVNGWAAWILTPFAAGLAYLLVQAVELALGRLDVEQS